MLKTMYLQSMILAQAKWLNNAELKTKAGEYSIADLERECLILVGKFAMTETKTEEVEPETEPTITFALDEAVETKPSRYSDIYETYKSR